MMQQGKPRRKRWVIVAVCLLVLLVVATVAYVCDVYVADGVARAALESDGEVTVLQTDGGWTFDGPSTTDALVYYPGAKVEPEAYAPLLRLVAAKGADVFLVRMPLNFAILNLDAASDVIDEHAGEYERWHVGGHSLGGAMAAQFAARSPEGLHAVVLCGAYAPGALGEGITEVLVYGSNDWVLNRARVAESRELAAGQVVEHVIEGGNHAQFGSYGPQGGDGEATISPESQWREAADVIVGALAAA